MDGQAQSSSQTLEEDEAPEEPVSSLEALDLREESGDQEIEITEAQIRELNDKSNATELSNLGEIVYLEAWSTGNENAFKPCIRSEVIFLSGFSFNINFRNFQVPFEEMGWFTIRTREFCEIEPGTNQHCLELIELHNLGEDNDPESCSAGNENSIEPCDNSEVVAHKINNCNIQFLSL